MSIHKAEVIQIDKIHEHPNADSLGIVKIKGFTCCVRLEDFKEGDLAVYIEPDTIVSQDPMFDFLDEHRRIRVRRFRGILSQGLLMPAPTSSKIGDDVFEKWGLEHYEPPLPMSANGENEGAPPGYYPKYDVENFNRYLHVFEEGEEVFISEKVHGCVNSQTGISLPDGSRKRIQELFDQQYKGEVLGVDEDGKITTSRVRNVFKNGCKSQWLIIRTTRTGCGRGNSFATLHCTPEHEVYDSTAGHYRRADSFKVGDTVNLIRSEAGLTPVQEQVLIGKMLGDGNLLVANEFSASLRFSHKREHLEYLEWTLKGLGELAGNRQLDRISGYDTKMVVARSKSNGFVYKNFINWVATGKKEFPKSFIDKVGPIALAFWYMDDGSLSHHDGQEDRALLATNSFSKGSIDNLVKSLKIFGINAIPYQAHGWRLRLNADDAEKLFLLISPYIPRVMQYKLPERYRGHEGWLPGDKSYKPIITRQIITEIKNWKLNQQRYDLETETHNYFANGVLIHNCNSRFTFVDGRMRCGSHTCWKKENEQNLWWQALRQNPAIEAWCRTNPGLTLYAETYGQVQNLTYGTKRGQFLIAGFDVLKGNEWLSWNELESIRSNIPWVPVLYQGPYSESLAREFAEGNSLIAGADHIREGCVIKPVRERTCPEVGRVMLKIVSNAYLEGKKKKKKK